LLKFKILFQIKFAQNLFLFRFRKIVRNRGFVERATDSKARAAAAASAHVRCERGTTGERRKYSAGVAIDAMRCVREECQAQWARQYDRLWAQSISMESAGPRIKLAGRSRPARFAVFCWFLLDKN
jgi:hypothetical protein